jgi:MerR family transcriptional regulator, light-induced transcriptional regulator
VSGGPSFATRLRELRLERGLRQKDLAEALGLAQTTVANYEQSTRFPDETTLRKIAAYFRVGFDGILGSAADQGSTTGVESSGPGGLGKLAQRYLERLRARDEPGAVGVVQEALSAGEDSRRVYLDLLEPTLHEVGRLWELGEIDVAEEHRITNTVDRHMAETRAASRNGTRPNGRRFACMTVPGDEHLLGARMVSDFLEMDGWRSSYLGGNLSIGHALEALEADPPDLLLLSATVAQSRHAVEDMIAAVRARPSLRSLRILVGGQLLARDPALWRRAGADGTAAGAEEAVEAARRLFGSGSVGGQSRRAAAGPRRRIR